MDGTFYLVVGATVFAAATVQGIIGFGFGMIAMSVVPLFVDIKVAVPTVTVFSLTLNAMLLWRLRRHFDWRNVAPLLGGAALGVPLGILVLRSWDTTALKTALGIIILLFVANSVLRPAAAARRNAITPAWAWPLGAIAGVLQGGLNTGGPPVVIYTTLTNWSKDVIKATLQAFFGTIGVSQIIIFMSTGMLTPDGLLANLLLLPTAIGGLWVGGHIDRRVDHALFRRFVLGFLAIMGVMFIVRG